jgi:hypothetical protein
VNQLLVSSVAPRPGDAAARIWLWISVRKSVAAGAGPAGSLLARAVGAIPLVTVAALPSANSGADDAWFQILELHSVQIRRLPHTIFVAHIVQNHVDRGFDRREAEEPAQKGTIPGAVRAPRGMLEFYADPVNDDAGSPLSSSGLLRYL